MEELRRSNDTISVSEIVYDGQAEQGVELDHTLPDYYPEIFKILSCRLTPRILSYSLLGDSKMMLDGCVDIRVLYLAEGSDAINCIEQHYTYSKTVEIGKGAVPDAEDVCIKLTPRADYCNCRAVSGRRIDVRGAVSTKIHITAQKSYSLPRIPESIQLKKAEVTCCGSNAAAEKQFTVREEIETGAHGISCLIRSIAIPKVTDVRIIADKVIVKGVVTINASYGISSQEEQGCRTVERMSADIPVSQIMDIADIDDSFTGNAELDVLNCELECSSDSGIIRCNILAVCRVTCSRQEDVLIPVDAFSTEYEIDQSVGQLKIMRSCTPVSKQFSLKSQLNCDCGEIESVLDCSADIYNLSCTIENDNALSLKGAMCTQALCRTTDGMICYNEKQESFEYTVPVDNLSKNTTVTFNALCNDTDYTIRSDGALDISVKIDFEGLVCIGENISMLESITIHEDKPLSKDNRYALKICYANGDENCWTIAKKYRTPVSSVMTENDISDEDTLLSGMVIIPAM
ncbi:MAG: DUF3794 domain-containing protein [Ruminococcaceae bacterium]|nr:DUF3794 domain-containing protein [Oscillospiraceae bacterium]